MSWYSNSLERKYYIYNDLLSKKKYRKVLITIFLVLVVIYSYFLSSSYNDLINIKPTDKKKLIKLSFLGSLLVFISGLIFLYIAYTDKDLNVELAFN